MDGFDSIENETQKKKTNDSYWLTQMKARMGDANSAAGHKGCPNKYNIWHRCSLYCVNRWKEGKTSPSSEYMARYRRLVKRYPLPKGWVEMYDPGCGCYYFASEAEGLVSWLPPTHPKSQVTKSAALIRQYMEENGEEDYSDMLPPVESDEDSSPTDDSSPPQSKRQRKREMSSGNTDLHLPESMMNSSQNGSSIIDNEEFPSLLETCDNSFRSPSPRRQKSRDLEKVSPGQKKERLKSDRMESSAGSCRRSSRMMDNADLDPMDPSAYSDAPRGKWSTGLHKSSEDQEKRRKPEAEKGDGKNN